MSNKSYGSNFWITFVTPLHCTTTVALPNRSCGDHVLQCRLLARETHVPYSMRCRLMAVVPRPSSATSSLGPLQPVVHQLRRSVSCAWKAKRNPPVAFCHFGYAAFGVSSPPHLASSGSAAPAGACWFVLCGCNPLHPSKASQGNIRPLGYPISIAPSAPNHKANPPIHWTFDECQDISRTAPTPIGPLHVTGKAHWCRFGGERLYLSNPTLSFLFSSSLH